MVSIVFLVIGIFFGISSSIYAKSKNRHAENWFTIGLFFWFFSLLALYILSDAAQNDANDSKHSEEFSFPY